MTAIARTSALTCAALALVLAGCGSDSVRPDTTVKARLDRGAGQVVLPLDDFAPSVEDGNVTARASQAVLRECLNRHGQKGLRPAPDATGPGLDRPYGLWLPERAAREGFIPPQSTEQPSSGEWSDEMDPAFNAAYETCRGEIGGQMDAVNITDELASTGIVGEIEGKAHALAEGATDWKAARDEWKSCIRKNGLTPRGEQSAWSSAEAQNVLSTINPAAPDPALKQEEIRIATIEATCNEQTNLTQRLGDIEASYQAPLIKQNEAALRDIKAKIAQRVDAAHAYLASHQ